MSINCTECGNWLEDVHDTTYSNMNTKRCYDGQHTGDIYRCEDCDVLWIDDFLTNTVHYWNY